jgi:cytochrome P450
VHKGHPDVSILKDDGDMLAFSQALRFRTRAVRFRAGLPYFGPLFQLRRDPLAVLRRAARLGNVVWFRVGPRRIFLVPHPDAVRRVLVDNYRGYNKRTRGYEVVRLFLGNGLLTSEGDFWRRQRRIAQPAFHRARIEHFGSIMQRAAASMVEEWAEYARRRERFDVCESMMRLTLRIVGECLLSTDPSGESDRVGGALSTLLQSFIKRTTALVTVPRTWPTPHNLRIQHAVKTLDDVVLDIIAERRRAGVSEKGDLLDMLMEARDEDTGERMNDRQLRDEVMTIFLAGHETTANALSWTWYLLAQNPAVEAKLHAELTAVLGRRTPSFADLPALPYTLQVLKESLRLYPPAWVMGRSAEVDDEICGAKIPQGAVIFVSPYVTHRLPEFWPDPERFDPERFSEQRTSAMHKFAYFPFGGGPRVCIGNTFALMEGQLLLATLAQRFRVRLVSQRKVEPDPQITLRPRHGIKVFVEPTTA